MQRGGAVLAQRFQMIGGGVALVAGKAVLRVYRIPFLHARVPVRLGEDGGRSNGDAAAVALDERLLFDEHVELHGVDQQVIRRDRKLLERGGHGLAAGLINIPGINALRVHLGNGPGQRVLANALGKLSASVRSDLLRIIEPNDAPLRIENDGGGNHRAEERAAAGFIQTGDARPTEFTRGALEARAAETAHSAAILAREQKLETRSLNSNEKLFVA